MNIRMFFTMLVVLLIGLKLTDHIDWSWWLVLLPIYWPFAVLLFVWIAILVIGCVLFFVDSWESSR